MADKPSLLLVEPVVVRRLKTVSALRDSFALLPEEEGDPVRRVRAARPDLVLLSLSGGAGALRLCRALKTEPRPVPVGLLDPDGAAPPDAELFSEWLADGLFGDPLDAEALERFCRAVIAGERPVSRGRSSLLRRLRGSLSRLGR